MNKYIHYTQYKYIYIYIYIYELFMGKAVEVIVYTYRRGEFNVEGTIIIVLW